MNIDIMAGFVKFFSYYSQYTFLDIEIYRGAGNLTKVDPFTRVKGWLSDDNSARACSDRLALPELGNVQVRFSVADFFFFFFSVEKVPIIVNYFNISSKMF